MCKNHSHVTVGYMAQSEVGPLRLTIVQTVQPVRFEHAQVIAQLVVQPGVLVYIEDPARLVRQNTVEGLGEMLAALVGVLEDMPDDDDVDAPPAVPAPAGADQQK